MPPTRVHHPDLTAITVFLASTATPERGGLPYLDAVLPAEDRLAATRVVRDLGALPPDAILYLLAQPLLDLASDHLLRDRDLTTRYEERFEVEDSDEWMAAMAEHNRDADATTAAPPRAPGGARSAQSLAIDTVATRSASSASVGRRKRWGCSLPDQPILAVCAPSTEPPGSNRRRPAWEAFLALVGQGFFGGGSRNRITQYAGDAARFRP